MLLLANFHLLSEGVLFENFFISEKMKRLHYDQFYGSTHFCRNTQQVEINFFEINEGKINIYEIKNIILKGKKYLLNLLQKNIVLKICL